MTLDVAGILYNDWAANAEVASSISGGPIYRKYGYEQEDIFDLSFTPEERKSQPKPVEQKQLRDSLTRNLSAKESYIETNTYI